MTAFQGLRRKPLQTPEGLRTYHKGELAKWWPIIKAANIKPE
jgi:hypothetical protein